VVPNSYRLEWFQKFGYISQEEKPHQVNTHSKSSPSHGFPRPRYKNAPRKNLKQEVINGTCMFFCLQWSLYIMHQLNINTKNSIFLYKFDAQMNMHAGACQFTQMGTQKRVVKVMFLLIWCSWTQVPYLLIGRSMP